MDSMNISAQIILQEEIAELEQWMAENLMAPADERIQVRMAIINKRCKLGLIK